MILSEGDESRLWSRVIIPKNVITDCWLWNAGKNSWGYGYFKVDGKTKIIHRLVYELLKGSISDGLQIDHLCKIRNCVNPNHLEPVTPKENVRRSSAFGSIQQQGERGSNARLTSEQIKEVKRLYSTGSFTQKELGEMFGISFQHVSQIVNNKRWKHLSE